MNNLQTSSLHYCNDDNPKTWKHIVEYEERQESLANCDNHRDELQNSSIKIISEEYLK